MIKYGLLKPCENIEKQIHKIQNKLGTCNDQILSETLDMMTSVKLFSSESYHLKGGVILEGILNLVLSSIKQNQITVSQVFNLG